MPQTSSFYERWKQQRATPTPNPPPISPTAPPSSGSSFYEKWKQQRKQPPPLAQPTTGQRLIAGGLRTIPAIAGGVLGSGLPIAGNLALGAAGAGLGEGLAEWYEKGQNIRKEFNPTQVATQTALGAIPFLGKAPGFGAGAREIGKYALKGAAQGAVLGGASTVPTQWAEDRTLPSIEDVGWSTGIGGLFGGAASAGLGKLASTRGIDPNLLPKDPVVKTVPDVTQPNIIPPSRQLPAPPKRTFIVTPSGKVASSLDPNLQERLDTLENRPPGTTVSDYDKRHGEYFNIGERELPPVDLSVVGERKGPDVYPAQSTEWNPGHPEGKFEGPFALSEEERAIQAQRQGRRNQGIGVRQPETNTVFVTIESGGNKRVHTVSIRPDENPAEAVRKYMASRNITGDVTHAEVVKGPAKRPAAEAAIRGKVISGEETPADWLSDDPLYSHVPDRLRPEPPNVGRLRTLSEGAEKKGATGPVPKVEPISGPRFYDLPATTVRLSDDVPPVTPNNPPLTPLPELPMQPSAPPREGVLSQRRKARTANPPVINPANLAKAKRIILDAKGPNKTGGMSDDEIIGWADRIKPGVLERAKPLPSVTKPTGGPSLSNTLPAVDTSVVSGIETPKGNIADDLEIETDEVDFGSSIIGKKRNKKVKAGTSPIPVEGEIGSNIKDLINYRGFMKKNPVFKAIMDKFIKHRSVDRLISRKVREDFKNISNIPKEDIVKFQKAVNAGNYPEVRKFFDDMHSKLQGEGIEVGFKKEYLPQMWDNSEEEVAKAFGDKELNAKASFQFRSFIEDYEKGIAKGLTPAKSPIELLDYYATRANKLLADTEAIKYLRAFGYIEDSYKPGLEALDPNIITFGKHYANPAIKKVLEGFLKSKETQSPIGSVLSKGIGKWSNALLSAGVLPNTPIATAHGLNIANPIGGRAMQEGGFKRVKQSLVYGFNPKKAVERLNQANEKMQWATKEHGYSAGIGDVSSIGPKLFEEEGKNVASKFGKDVANKITKLQHKYFEKPLLEEMLPALKWEAWESQYNKLIKRGYSDKEAGRLATEIADNYYGGANLDLLYNNKAFNNTARALLLAPDWFRTTFRLGGKMAKSTQFKTMPPEERIAYLGGAFKIMATYAAANLVHKTVNGTFMVENKNPFDFELGKDSKGNKRVYNLFGGAADLFKLGIDRMQHDDKAGEFEEQVDYLKNRTSPAVRAVNLAAQGRDYRGRPNLAKSTDTFGNEVPFTERLFNTATQAANLAPPLISQPYNLLSGEQGLEEALMRMTELPINYKHQKKNNRNPFTPFSPRKPSPFKP